MNTLYYGDNLDILRRYLKDESVDLVYLDPPFKSNQDYNVLFAEQNGTRSAAQIKAFEDTWRWDEESARTYQETVETGPERVSKVLQAFRTFLGDNDMLAYLSMMAPRLVELRRVRETDEGFLKPISIPIGVHFDHLHGSSMKQNRWGRAHEGSQGVPN
ncbi:MAG: hypothetical protein ABSF46_19375 [Terriglobia bacterium]|jgi:site-specific DNA-methyltransferase (adenine-specific)